MKLRHEKRIIALSVDWKSFGFVIFNGPHQLIDWGTRGSRGGVKVSLQTKLRQVFDSNRPDALVLAKPMTPKRTKIVAKLAKLAEARGISPSFVSTADIHKAFAPMNQSKYQIAAAIANCYPELLPQLPTPRKDWQSEKFGITIFEAAAAGFVYYGLKLTQPEN